MSVYMQIISRRLILLCGTALQYFPKEKIESFKFCEWENASFNVDFVAVEFLNFCELLGMAYDTYTAQSMVNLWRDYLDEDDADEDYDDYDPDDFLPWDVQIQKENDEIRRFEEQQTQLVNPE